MQLPPVAALFPKSIPRIYNRRIRFVSGPLGIHAHGPSLSSEGYRARSPLRTVHGLVSFQSSEWAAFLSDTPRVEKTKTYSRRSFPARPFGGAGERNDSLCVRLPCRRGSKLDHYAPDCLRRRAFMRLSASRRTLARSKVETLGS